MNNEYKNDSLKEEFDKYFVEAEEKMKRQEKAIEAQKWETKKVDLDLRLAMDKIRDLRLENRNLNTRISTLLDENTAYIIGYSIITFILLMCILF